MDDDEFSSSAQIGKHNIAVLCTSPDIQYTDSFRDLTLQINPFHIMCAFKTIFDISATSNLRLADEDGLVDDEREIICSAAVAVASNRTPTTKTDSNSEPSSPRKGETVDMSNSCVYGAAMTSKHSQFCRRQANNLQLCGWDICERPHYVSCNGDRQQMFDVVIPECCPRHGKSARCQAISSAKSIPDTSNFKKKPYRFASLALLTRRHCQECSTGSGSHCSVSSSSIGNDRRFIHFKRNTSYMEQYRKDYTYKKIRDNLGTCVPPPSAPLPCTASQPPPPPPPSPPPPPPLPPAIYPFANPCSEIQEWYPKINNYVKSNTTSTSDKTILTAPVIPVHVIAVPKRKLGLKKRLPQAPLFAKARGDSKPSGKSNDGGPKVDTFANLMTVNNYNPTKTTSAYTQLTSSSSSSQGLNRYRVSLNGQNATMSRILGPLLSSACIQK